MAIVNYTNGERTAVFIVTVDHGQSLEEMIAAGCYDEVDNAVQTVSFSDQTEESQTGRNNTYSIRPRLCGDRSVVTYGSARISCGFH
jgi:hypothetical protein